MDIRQRIISNPDVLTGKPVIVGTRLSVQFIVGLLAKGVTHQELLMEYPYIIEEDIRACLAYASQLLESSTLIPLAA
ncbi:DUF433 domain-containing protein [Spirosoma sp. KCTC 42546]|uniref:DUF433 domain-containing protein n=1 Tax=Spirosoma sp. KCTC 42546 TaxID=2520506 RepID=UPI001158E70F|nr:DUF433 domain-containing protein [Spirosoma sp. KCTC 42546]QDK80548.1 DUF433 domain-containing protein [Spirosoma sp. KCTC 42546]